MIYHNNGYYGQARMAPVAPQQEPVAASAPEPIYRAAPAQRSDFRGSCAVNTPPASISVPKVEHILHRMPFIVERVTEEVTTTEIPIAHTFSTRTYQPQIERACRTQAPCAPVKKPCGGSM